MLAVTIIKRIKEVSGDLDYFTGKQSNPNPNALKSPSYDIRVRLLFGELWEFILRKIRKLA